MRVSDERLKELSTASWTMTEHEVRAIARELRELRHEIGEHLAMVHGDGGHHQAAVGTVQAIRDATNKVINKETTP